MKTETGPIFRRESPAIAFLQCSHSGPIHKMAAMEPAYLHSILTCDRALARVYPCDGPCLRTHLVRRGEESRGVASGPRRVEMVAKNIEARRPGTARVEMVAKSIEARRRNPEGVGYGPRVLTLGERAAVGHPPLKGSNSHQSDLMMGSEYQEAEGQGNAAPWARSR